MGVSTLLILPWYVFFPLIHTIILLKVKMSVFPFSWVLLIQNKKKNTENKLNNLKLRVFRKSRRHGKWLMLPMKRRPARVRPSRV